MKTIVAFVIFLIAATAETNHPPFDLVEAEQELVGGFNTEYTGIRFAIFFLAEFMNVITMSAIAVTLFLGGPSGPSLGFLARNNVVNMWVMPIFWFLVEGARAVVRTVWVRASLPRMRYDRLMSLGWKWLIEIAILWVLVTATRAGRARTRAGTVSSPRSIAWSSRDRGVRRAVRVDAEVGRADRGDPLMGRFSGFLVTLRQMGKPRLTTEYPKVKHDKPERLHGRHVLNRYEDGMEKCIGCELCAGVCPARCIYVRGADNPIDDPVSPGERYGFVYEINYLRCIHCDLCVEACPTEAITETKLFEFSFTNRSDAIYTKDELLVDDDGPRPADAVGALDGRRGRRHERVDARRRRRRVRARTKAGSTGRASSASACGRPNTASRRRRRGREPHRRQDRTLVEAVVFFVCAAAVLAGALGVITGRNPVHSALFLLITLVSVAVLFLQQDAALVAAVQIVVYASAIVVLFLFVITLLGVDQHEVARRRASGPTRRPRSCSACSRWSGIIVLVPATTGSRARTRPAARSTPRERQRRDARQEPVHRLRLGVRDHRGAARDRGRRRRRARPAQRPPARARRRPRAAEPRGRRS